MDNVDKFVDNLFFNTPLCGKNVYCKWKNYKNRQNDIESQMVSQFLCMNLQISTLFELWIMDIFTQGFIKINILFEKSEYLV